MIRYAPAEGKILELVRGDLTHQDDLEAVVNSANSYLTPGGGVSGALHRVAGPGLYEEAKRYAPIGVSECIITGAYGLPNRYVIHCRGPIFGRDLPSDELLSKTYENALLLADSKGVRSVGFPSISTGIYGYPVEEASRIALKTILDVLPRLKNVRRVRMVLWGEDSYRTYVKALKELVKEVEEVQ
ncbi:MAG: RNase III inhibitor [Thermotogae bacterium]|nr:RNase III inhibitor [Thermotogota bacterium]